MNEKNTAEVQEKEPVAEKETAPVAEPEKPKQEETKDGEQESSAKKPVTRAKVKKNFQRWFRKQRIALDLSKTDPQLIAYAGQVGYDEAALAEGTALQEALEAAYKTQSEARTNWNNATQVFDEQKESTSTLLKRLLKEASLAFDDDPETFRTLGLKKARLTAHGDWMLQNKLFIDQLLANQPYIDKMITVGSSLEKIQAVQTELTKTIQADVEKENTRALSQDATDKKNQAFNEFDTWMKRFLTLMRAALQDEPQLKEQLGFVTK